MNQLRKKFLQHISKRWYCFNTYDKTYKALPEKSGVYVIAHFDSIDGIIDLVYVGSSTNLFCRYKSHKVPNKIKQLSENGFSVLYFIEMEKGFYDYERKLILKLNPLLNVQHKQKGQNG